MPPEIRGCAGLTPIIAGWAIGGKVSVYNDVVMQNLKERWHILSLAPDTKDAVIGDINMNIMGKRNAK